MVMGHMGVGPLPCMVVMECLHQGNIPLLDHTIIKVRIIITYRTYSLISPFLAKTKFELQGVDVQSYI